MKTSMFVTIDPMNNVIRVSHAAAKKAMIYGTPEYLTLVALRRDYPEATIEIAAKQSTGNKLTIKKMKDYIKECKDADTRLKVFERVEALSKSQASPYFYIKKWFLDNYANYSEEPVLDEDGYVIVKTRAQMKAEAEAAATSNAPVNEDDHDSVEE